MRTFICIFISLTLAGCAVPESAQVRDGKEYGRTSGLFRHKWWNFYERGLSYAEGEFYVEAIHDLKKAIQKRNDDKWSSRTYGMHVVDYFPHRELGIIYYRTGKYTDADAELEASLITAESAKAKYFLNKTRKALLEESGNDLLPPDLKIYSPPSGSITNKRSVQLKGKAEDDHFVSAVSVGNYTIPIELSAQKVHFDQEIFLKRGLNNIGIEVTDLLGKRTKSVLKIQVDREGPLIIIDNQESITGHTRLTGFITDMTEVSSFTINGKPVALEPLSNDSSIYEFAFQQDVILSDDSNYISLAVKDAAGNRTTGELTRAGPVAWIKTLPLFAMTDFEDSEIKKNIYAFLDKMLQNLVDDSPPEINLKDIANLQTVYTDSIFLEGSVSDESKIASLFINGESALKRKGKKVFFNYITSLNEGENRLFIEAVDLFGNKSNKEITVTRKIPRVREIGSRMSISILPFQTEGNRSVAGDAVYDSLITSFIHQQRFHLVERERVEEVLEELRLSNTELADPDRVVQLGNLVVADAILIGTIHETDSSIEIFTRLVDTETSDIMDVADIFDETISLHAIKELTEILALKYTLKFPLLEGLIIKKNRESILTDMGKDKKMKRNMKMILFREVGKVVHPVSNQYLGAETEELGEAKITRVYPAYSEATIKKGDAARITTQDMVITK